MAAPKPERLKAADVCQLAQVQPYVLRTWEAEFFMLVEQMPEFPGGDAALLKFLQNNIQYPSLERDNDIQGRVIVGFTVFEDGTVGDVNVKRGVSKGLDEEAVRVVKKLPNFKSGKPNKVSL